jgi:hypothetical protein
MLNGDSWSVHFVPSKYRCAGAPDGSGYQPGGNGVVIASPFRPDEVLFCCESVSQSGAARRTTFAPEVRMAASNRSSLSMVSRSRMVAKRSGRVQARKSPRSGWRESHWQSSGFA